MSIFKNNSRDEQILEKIDNEILRNLRRLETIGDDKERDEIIKRIDFLTKTRRDYREEKFHISRQIDMGTIFKVVAGTTLTMAILAFEKEDIINTKSFNLGTRMIGL